MDRRHQKERDDLEAERRAYYDSHNGNSSSGNNTAASPDPEYEERFQQKKRALDERHEKERRDFEQRYMNECEARHKQATPQRPDRRGHDGAVYPGEHPEPAHGQHPDRAPPGSDRPYDDPCGDIHSETDAKFERVHRDFEAQWEAIRAEYDAFYSDHDFTEAEERAFHDKMRQREEDLRQRQDEAFRQIEQDVRDRCRELMREHMKHERETRKAEDQRRLAREMRDVPPEMAAAMEEMYLLQAECEEESFRLHDEFEETIRAKQSRNAQPSQDGAPPTAAEPYMGPEHAEFEAKMRKHWDACDARMRALWETKVGVLMEEGEHHDRMGSWKMEERDGSIYLHGKYMSLVGDPSTNTFGRISVAGQTYVEHVYTEGMLTDFEMDEGDRGSVLKASGGGLRAMLHDNPSGLIKLHAKGGDAFLVEIPSTFKVERTDSGWKLTNGAAKALLRGNENGVTYDESEHTFRIFGEAVFLLPDKADNHVLDKVGNKHRGEIKDAIEAGRLGAEVTLLSDADGEALDDTLVYEDVEVEVAKADTKDKTVEIVVSSDTLEEGKTFVVNVDTEILSLAAELDISYFDIDEDSGAETPAEIRRASSLSDVLDATDDETAEYWLVQDLDGFQVLFSVPHWSTHKVVVQSGEAADEPAFNVPAPGIVLVIAAAALAAVVVSRRRD